MQMTIRRLHAQCLKKKRYHNEYFAEKIAKRCMDERGVKLRVYWCSNCCGFHLTHQAELQEVVEA